MKIHRLDAHERLQHFTKQEFDIGATCQSIIDQRPFGNNPFYIFAHSREIALDERIGLFNADLTYSLKNASPREYTTLVEVPTKRIIWQPRLTKPLAQTNSMLFKAYPNSDNLKVIWIIPMQELWEQFTKGKMMENKTVVESIYDYQHNRAKLEAPEDDDMKDEDIQGVYRDIAITAKYLR